MEIYNYRGMTFPVTEAILQNAPSKAKPTDVVFIMNMKRAWEFLFDTFDLSNDLPLLRQFNKICGEGLIYECGDLRKRDVVISGCSYIPAIPDYQDVIDSIHKLNTIDNSLYRAIAFFCFVARRQLFIDGNKRVAQLILNKILIESGIGVLYIKNDSIVRFKEVLVRYYDTGDPTEIFEFLKNSIYYFD